MEKKNAILKIVICAVLISALFCAEIGAAVDVILVVHQIRVDWINASGTYSGISVGWGSEPEFWDTSYHQITDMRTAGTEYLSSTCFVDGVLDPNMIYTMSYDFYMGSDYDSKMYEDFQITNVFLSENSNQYTLDLDSTQHHIIYNDYSVSVVIVIDTTRGNLPAEIAAHNFTAYGFGSSFPAPSNGCMLFSCKDASVYLCESDGSGDSGSGDSGSGDSGSGDSGSGDYWTEADTILNQKVDELQSDLDNMSNDMTVLNDKLDALADQPQAEYDKADSDGNKYVDQVLGELDIMPTEDIIGAFMTISDAFMYDGTSSQFKLPALKVPFKVGSEERIISMWDEQVIDAGILLDKPEMKPIYTVTKFIFSFGCVYYFWYELKSLLTGKITFRKSSASNAESSDEG